MKFFFDQNLSHRLPTRLSDHFPNSSHVCDEGMDRATDEQIWDFAKLNGFCIVSQDADFAERSNLYGAPPKVIWMRCGNQTAEVERILRSNFDLIFELIHDDSLYCLEIM